MEQPEPADIGVFTKAKFRTAVGCTDCKVLTLSPMNLPETGVKAVAAKLRGEDFTLYDVTLDDAGVVRDHKTLVDAEDAAAKAKHGKATAQLDTWLASATPSDRRWIWMWTASTAPTGAKEPLLADKSVAKKHHDDVEADLAGHVGKVRKALQAAYPLAEIGDGGGPLLRAKLTAKEAIELSKMPEVMLLGVDAYPGKADSGSWGTSSQWGATLRLASAHSAYGTGAGAKVCVKEPYQPDSTSQLSIANTMYQYAPTASHTRGAIGIIRNNDTPSAPPWAAVAPSALIYLADYAGYNGSADDWCRTTAGASTLSYSYDVLGTTYGPLAGTDMAHDWLAKNSPWVLVVAAAGTKDVGSAYYVANRGMNGLVVGGIDDRNTADPGDDLLDGTIAYGNPQTLHNDHELPQVAAPSNGASPAGTTITGSSAGTAMVAGIGALLEGVDSSFASWPEMKRSVIIATATRRADQGLFSSLPLASDGTIGAGVVDAFQAATLGAPSNAVSASGNVMAEQGRFAATFNFSSAFGADAYSVGRWKAKPTQNGRLRVVLTWDATAACSGGSCTSDVIDADLDLHVVQKAAGDSSWTVTGVQGWSSSTWDSAWEAVDIPVTASTEYLIAISKHQVNATSTYLSLAWYSYRQYAGGPCSTGTDCASGTCTAGKCACATDSDCPDRFCNASGQCTNREANGTACSRPAMCTSSSCADGVCCDTDCTATCKACTAALKGTGADGTCGNVIDGRDPKLQCPGQSCSSATVTYAQVCAGTGSCRSNGSSSCGTYQCNGTACGSWCDGDTDCTAGNWCSGGSCIPKLANGSACALSSNCASGFCADGYCCNSACDSSCQACDVAGSHGICTTISGAPRHAGSGCGGGACGGFCDGINPTCTQEPAGKSCSDSNACNGAEVCNGAGTCSAGTPINVDDGNSCTTDSCDPSTGAVTHVSTATGSCPPRWNPGSLTWTQLSPTSARLVWSGATHGSGINSYKIFKNGVDMGISSLTATTYDVTGLVTGAVNWFTVQAVTGSATSSDGPTAAVQTADTSVATDPAATSSYLYTDTGTGAPQTGLTTTIDPKRGSVMRGTVTYAAGGGAVVGAKVTIAGHPEYGYTFTRSGGAYDIAVNGGSRLAVRVELAGHVPVQRAAYVPWEDYVVMPTIALTTLDTTYTDITSSAVAWQTATATLVPAAGNDLARTATLMFPPGTVATVQPRQVCMTNADCGGATCNTTTHQCPATTPSNLRVRATELTKDGDVNAMPGELPERVAYTYAVSLDADEATAANGSVQFSNASGLKPVFYVENFVQKGCPSACAPAFDVGMDVPVGYYDPDRAIWAPEKTGRVIKILSVDAGTGMPVISVNATGTASTQAERDALAISDGELAQISDRIRAGKWSVGQLLWRFEVGHFSSWDANWGVVPPIGAVPPEPGNPPNDPDNPCKDKGSIIECETQVLGEQLPVAGTPLSLAYSSSRAQGRDANRTARFRLTGASGTYPSNVKRIDVEWQIAGQAIHESFVPAPNLWATFTWDGKDASGKTVEGRQPLRTRVGYVYTPVYGKTSAFGYTAGAAITGANPRAGGKPGGSAAVARAAGPVPTYADELTFWKEIRSTLGTIDTATTGLGGWDIDVHHTYDPLGHFMFKGSGERVAADTTKDLWMSKLVTAGSDNPGCWPSTEGGSTTCSTLGSITSVAAGPDGSVYFALAGATGRIGRLYPDGVFRTAWAGSAPNFGDTTRASLAVGPDGKLYFGSYDGVIRRVDVEGTTPTVVTVRTGLSGGLRSIAFAPDGSLFTGEASGAVRRIAPPPTSTDLTLGTLSTFATAPYTTAPVSVAVDRAGVVYVAASGTNCGVFKLLPGSVSPTDGSAASPVWTPIIGAPSTCANGGDNGPSTSATTNPFWIQVGVDGVVFVQEVSGPLRAVGVDGIVRQIAFSHGWDSSSRKEGAAWDGAIGGSAPYLQFAIAPRGDVLVADRTVLWKLSPKVGGVSTASYVVSDGPVAHLFDSAGRHQSTRDVARNKTLWSFTYNSKQQLRTITDRNGQVTTIVHTGETFPDGSTLTTANHVVVVSPFGQRTEMALNSDGSLLSIADPAAYTWTTTWNPTFAGLLDRLDDPDGTHLFTWETSVLGEKGNLLTDSGPAGTPASPATRLKTLTKSSLSSGWQVQVATKATDTVNYTKTHQIEYGVTVGSSSDLERRTVTGPDGVATVTTRDAVGNTVTTSPTGLVTTTSTKPDPILGRQSPIREVTTQATTSYGTLVRSVTTPTTTFDVTSPFTIDGYTWRSDTTTEHGSGGSATTTDMSWTTKVTRNGDGTSTVLKTTTGGRWLQLTLDSAGNVTTVTYPGSAQYTDTSKVPYQTTTTMTWNLGRLSSIARGTRVFSWDYSTRTDGFVNYFQDALLHRVTFPADGYDLVGRVKKATFADSTQLLMSYEPGTGRLSSLTPPGRPAHAFTWNRDGNLDKYTAPQPSPSDTTTPRVTDNDWDVSGFPTLVTRPGGGTVSRVRDPVSGKLIQVIDSAPTSHSFSHIYDSTKGWETLVLSSDTTNYASLAFDHDGPLPKRTTWSDGVTAALEKQYDNHFRVAQRTINPGANAPYESLVYDSDGRLSQITTSPIASTTTLAYHAPTGFLTDITVTGGGSSFTSGWTYNAFGEAKTYTAKRNTTTLFTSNYEIDPSKPRDALGRIVKKQESMDDGIPHTYEYVYDAMNRLTEVHVDGSVPPTEKYEYGTNGTRSFVTSPATGGVRTAANYDDQDRIQSFNGTTYTFQPSGELATSTTGGVTTTYTYDGRGNLLKAQIGSTKTIQYVVDPTGRRVGRKTTVGTATIPDSTYIYDGQLRIVGETFTQSSVSYTTHYIYGTRPNVPEAMIRYQTGTTAGDVYRIITDHLGSVRLVVNASDGGIMQRMTYDAFGVVQTDLVRNLTTGALVALGSTTDPTWIPVPFGFGGGIYDRDTKFVRFGRRDLNNAVGAWMDRDPLLQAAGTNFYRYSWADPVNFIDPDGEFPRQGPSSSGWSIWDIIRDIRDIIVGPPGGGGGGGGGGDIGMCPDTSEPFDCAGVKNSCIAECSDELPDYEDKQAMNYQTCLSNCLWREEYYQHGCN